MRDASLGEVTLTLFFTGGVSLATWAQVGNLDRELEIYRRLSTHLGHVNVVTYGGGKDRQYVRDSVGISILPSKWHNSLPLTVSRLLLRYVRQMRNTDVFKTNQIFGSDVALRVARIFGKKLIVRAGYLYSYAVKQQSADKQKVQAATRLERDAFLHADLGVVAASWQRDFVIKHHNVDPDKVIIIPNYVVTDIFRPHPEIPKKYDLAFVGRAGPEKNIDNLLRAIHHLRILGRNVSLLMVGGCSYDNAIRERVNSMPIDVTFQGNVPNFDLPHLLNQASAFILPSHYEGHSKALLEAMSCGMPCIGSDVTGIKDDVEHMRTGYLCKTDYKSIADAIETVLSDGALRDAIGKNARDYVVGKYDVSIILAAELDALRLVIA